MPRRVLNLMDPGDLTQAQAQWRYATGLVPGEPNEGLVSQLPSSPARLPDYDDSGWDVCHDLTKWVSHGFSFVWYRTKFVLPETVGGHPVHGVRLLFETCVDDYGEVWIDGECDRERGTVAGFNVPQRILINIDSRPGEAHNIAILAANGPMAEPGGAIFLRYANLCFEWREDA